MSRDDALPGKEVGALTGGWVLVVGAAAAGLISLSLVDQVVLFAVAVVLPLAVGGPGVVVGRGRRVGPARVPGARRPGRPVG